MSTPERVQRLGELAVHGANVQPGQTLLVNAELGQEQLARAVAAAGYARGAKFVDVSYFDPYVKRERIRHGHPELIEFVPPWYGQRMRRHADEGGARVTFAGSTAPGLLDGLDQTLVGRDRLPYLPEIPAIVAEQSTNWAIVPCPHPAWARLVYPELSPDEADARLWHELEHVLRLDESDPAGEWDKRIAALTASARLLGERRFTAMELRGPGTDLRVGLLPTHSWLAAEFVTRSGITHIANLPTEEVFTTPDPQRTQGHFTATKPLVLRDGTIIPGLRARFENGVVVELAADENVEALRAQLAIDDGALRLGELALVDGQGRIGPLETVFFETLLDENAATHVAFGSGFPFLVQGDDVPRVNTSGNHIDVIIGSNQLDVDGVTEAGDRVPVLRGGAWQIG